MKNNFLLLFLLMIACNENYTPKPKAYLKLDFPKKEFKKIDIDVPFIFQQPIYSKIKKINNFKYDLFFFDFSATLHISYFRIDNNLNMHIEQSRKLAYKHNRKADAISEQIFINRSKRVYGLMYNYSGLTATSTQFYLTDSINHFFRGALYFKSEINDSIRPMNDFIKSDIKTLIETFYWNDKSTLL